LGATGILVSEIGFGAWGIGGVVKDSKAYGPTDDSVSRRALLTALDAGVTFFDTSSLYGYGHSEELIGETLHAARDQIIISTKAGYVDFGGAQNFTPSYLRSSLESSLRRLQTDYVDVFQLHDPPIELLMRDDSILEAMKMLQKEGKFRVAGISTRTPPDSFMAANHLGFKSIQVNFSLLDQRALEINLFDVCKLHGVGIIARTPLCFGFLTGKYSAKDDYAEGDHRKKWKPEQIQCWAEAYKLFKSGIENNEQQSNAQIALRYVLSFDAVSTTIPGMLNDAQVTEDVAASNMGIFPESVLAGFSEIYKKNTFIV
jgi:aryl-alcohol dehydrogenase-like predicted oxidoreductase